MPLYTDPKTAFFNNLNALNGASVNRNQMTLSKPVPTNGRWNDKDVTQNTAIKVTANPGAGWSGSAVFIYNRLDLNDLSILIGDTIAVPTVTNTAEFIRALNSLYGFVFDDSDIVIEPIYLTDGAGQVELKADPLSPWWIGSWNVTLTKGDEVLENIAKNTTLNGVLYPVSEDLTKRLGPSILYASDWSAYYEQLKALPVGTVMDQALVDIINAVQPYTNPTNPWRIIDTVSPANLKNTKVVYNGPADGTQYANSDRFQYALVLEPDVAFNAGIRGNLIMHYSKPSDPSEIEMGA